jgi:hypothetical protein
MISAERFFKGAFAGWLVEDVLAMLEDGITEEQRVTLTGPQLDVLALYSSREAKK